MGGYIDRELDDEEFGSIDDLLPNYKDNEEENGDEVEELNFD